MDVENRAQSARSDGFDVNCCPSIARRRGFAVTRSYGSVLSDESFLLKPGKGWKAQPDSSTDTSTGR
jgi:hypothetical protein